MARSQYSVIWKGINYDKYYSNATVARGVIQLIEVCRDIYEATANTMDSIEAKGVVNVSEHDILVPGYNPTTVQG